MGLFGNKNKPTGDGGSVDLRKKKIEERAVVLEKVILEKGIQAGQKSRVALVLDYSGSMNEMYNSGFVQDLVERLLPIGVKFDDNNAIDLFIFSSRGQAKFICEVTPDEFDGVVNREIVSKYNMGGTYYADAIKAIQEKYTSESGDPAYVMFITDGDNFDKPEATQAIIEASKHGIFFQFIGIGSASKRYLEELDDMDGRVVDNANFFDANKINKMSDEELYGKMMTEYPQWLSEAKAKSII